nr:galectin-8 isoform X3 [Symphalangus syndactylus]
MMLSLNNLQNIIYNPVIPYVGTIPDQLDPGTLIVIRGHVPSDADRFQVDLQNGSSVKPRADVAFHFNPRFKRAGCIVCNTLINEKWGREEITYDTPFKREKSFEIVMMVLKDKFQVPKSGTPQLSLPFAARLNTPMGPGRTVVVKGEVNANAKSFNVDLLAGKSKDIALHLNPRLNIKAFVRNSFLQESWGEEERNITSFPFSPGMYFEMIIYCDVREFKVAVNGVHSLEYKHRFKELSSIDTLEINGDIHLLEVRSW